MFLVCVKAKKSVNIGYSLFGSALMTYEEEVGKLKSSTFFFHFSHTVTQLACSHE